MGRHHGATRASRADKGTRSNGSLSTTFGISRSLPDVRQPIRYSTSAIPTLGAFTRILYSLEAAKPFVFIDHLDIKNRRARTRQKDQKKAQNPELVIRFDLYGYLRPSLS